MKSEDCSRKEIEEQARREGEMEARREVHKVVDKFIKEDKFRGAAARGRVGRLVLLSKVE